MASQYVTRRGEALDLICWDNYGRTSGAVEAVLDANPAIAEFAHAIPEGTILNLPDLAQAIDTAQIRLWS